MYRKSDINMSTDPGATTEPFSERSLACRPMCSGLPGAQGRGLAVFLTRRAARAGPHNAEAWLKDAPWLLFCLWANQTRPIGALCLLGPAGTGECSTSVVAGTIGIACAQFGAIADRGLDPERDL